MTQFMSHGIHAYGSFLVYDLFMRFDWLTDGEQLTQESQLMDFTL